MPRPEGLHTKHLTEAERQRCRTLQSDAGFSLRKIAAITGFTRSQVETAIKADSAKPRPRSGRPTPMTEEEIATLIDFVTASRRGRRMRFVDLASHLFGGKYGEYAIRYTLRRRGYRRYIARRKPPITEANRQKRLAWAQEHISWTPQQWASILWTDETWVTGGHHRRQWVTRLPGEEYDDTCIIEKHQRKGGWMFWGCFSGYGKGPGLFWEKDWGSISAEAYIEHTVPLIDAHLQHHQTLGREITLMQDGASGHRAAATLADLESRGITVEKWPPFSPDLNPIETVWNWMKDYIEDKYGLEEKPPTVKLRSYVTEAWNAVPESYLQDLLSTMPARCEAVIAANGRHTRF